MTSGTGSWITLRAGTRRATLSAASVRRIVPTRGVVPIPMTLAFVAGVLVWEGKAVPVYHLAELPLRVEDPGTDVRHAAGSEEEIVIVEIEGALAGFLVEATAAHNQERDAGACDAPALMAAAGVIHGGPQAAAAARGEL